MKENSLKSPLSQYIFCGSLNFLACISYVHSFTFFPFFPPFFVFGVFCSLSYTFLLVILRYSFFACYCCHFSFHQIVQSNTNTHICIHTISHNTHTDIRAVKQSSFLFGCNQAAHTIFLTSLWPAPDKLIPQRSHTHTHPCMCTLAKYCALPVGGDCYAASATCRNTKFASSPLHSFLSLFTQCSATTSAHTSVSHSWIFLQHKHTSAASAYKPLHTPDDACLSLCDCCLLLRYFQPPPTVVRKRKCIQNLIWQPWSWAKSAEGSRSTKWMGGKKDTTTTKNACRQWRKKNCYCRATDSRVRVDLAPQLAALHSTSWHCQVWVIPYNFVLTYISIYIYISVYVSVYV